MEIISTNIKDLVLIKPQVFEDERGDFFESYNLQKLQQIIPHPFVQDNQSLSKKNVLRGLHFQKKPFEQGKLVRVIHGSVLDVAVDIRKDSPTYLKYFKVILNSNNKLILWIPPGFAHGFLSLEEDTVFNYKCTEYYHKDSEETIRWNDPILNISWDIENPIISSKDKLGKSFAEIESIL